MNTFLKNIRRKNGISQEYLAKAIGVSRPTYSQIEEGTREMRVEEAQKLARYFDMSLEDFLAGRENRDPEVKLEKSEKDQKNQKEKASKPEMRISVPRERKEKFKEVLLYLLENLGALPNVGEAVICKIMYFIDFDYYEKYEEQLIGAKYIKNHHGPTPAAFTKIIDKMEEKGDLTPVTKKYFQYKQKKYLPLRKADLSKLSAREKELIDYEIERFKNFNAAKMENYSHNDVPWLSAEEMKPIEYESVFYRTPEYSVREYDEDNL